MSFPSCEIDFSVPGSIATDGTKNLKHGLQMWATNVGPRQKPSVLRTLMSK